MKYTEQGFTLLEVLIAAIVLTTSLLGLVVLQGVSKYSSYEARQRTVAMYIATDLQDRLRINKRAWMAQHLNTADATYSVSAGTGMTTISKPSCAQSNGLMSGCSQNDIVNLDLYALQEQLLGSAVSGSGNVMQSPVGCITLNRIDSRNAANATITISWQDREDLNGAFQDDGNTTCGTGGSTHRQYQVRTVL